MAIIKAFRGFRPRKEMAHMLACPPYDVINSDEARKIIKENPYSFLHVIKSEVDLPETTDLHSEQVYNKAKENLDKLIESGVYFQDIEPYLYIYAQTMNNRTQYGLVACASVDDYLNNNIKKHELTLPDKEEDRKTHIKVTNFNTEPVFFAYPDNDKINEIIDIEIKKSPEYDFVTNDGIGHKLWIIKNEKKIENIIQIFKNEIPYTYVADGHHRTAAAAKVGLEIRETNPENTGKEEYNFFLAVHFPASQLKILDYNRVIKDLNGYTAEQFINKIEENFFVEKIGQQAYRPEKFHEFSMYLEGNWYKLNLKPNVEIKCDPISILDVSILTCLVLTPILNISDLRRDKRIDFVGGIRGLKELEKRVDSGDMKVAFALYPVSMQQLFDIANTNNIMPPKTTWFEPKLRSGIILHEL
jgi:uncharacterized protein (DUF1015 family)